MTALLQALTGAGLPNRVGYVFQCMEVVERLVRPDDPPGTFMLLRPSEVLVSNLTVYEAHVRELLSRVCAGEDPRPGTAAEVLCGLLRSCGLAPLTRAAQGLCEHLWPQVMGMPVPDSGDLLREEWPKQWAEDLAAARKRLAQEWRRLPG